MPKTPIKPDASPADFLAAFEAWCSMRGLMAVNRAVGALAHGEARLRLDRGAYTVEVRWCTRAAPLHLGLGHHYPARNVRGVAEMRVKLSAWRPPADDKPAEPWMSPPPAGTDHRGIPVSTEG